MLLGRLVLKQQEMSVRIIVGLRIVKLGNVATESIEGTKIVIVVFAKNITMYNAHC